MITLAELGNMASEPELLESIQAPALVLHSPGDFAASQAASQAAFPSLGSDDKRYVMVDARNNHHLLWDWDHEDVKAEIMAFLAPSLPIDPAAGPGATLAHPPLPD